MPPGPPADEEERYTLARQRMVDRQIAARGISDPLILEAMGKVPRHLFVPPDLAESAYEDRPLPIGEGQTISQPYIVARTIELAQVRPHHRVCEVGTGCGYAAAVLASIAREVVTFEIRPRLARSARQRLAALGYDNVEVIEGDGSSYEGAFDRIVVAAAAERIPPTLEADLNEGGRLVIPVGGRFSQHLWTVERRGDEFVRSRHDAVAFVPLVTD